MQTSTINLDTLSETEKQLIIKQREQAKLQAEEKALQRKIETEKQIVKELQAITEFTDLWTRQNLAAHQFCMLLNEHSTFETVIAPQVKKFEVFQYNEKNERVSVWSQDVHYNKITIKHTTVDKIIIVEEHKTGSYSRSNHGFKMRIAYDTNRYTKDAKNMASKFIDILAQQQRKENENNKKATAKEQALIVLTDKYPTAKIEHNTEWVSYRRHGGRQQGPSGYEKNIYSVAFPNGYTINFNYELLHDGQLHIGYDSMKKPSGFDHSLLGDNHMLNALIHAIQNIA